MQGTPSPTWKHQPVLPAERGPHAVRFRGPTAAARITPGRHNNVRTSNATACPFYSVPAVRARSKLSSLVPAPPSLGVTPVLHMLPPTFLCTLGSSCASPRPPTPWTAGVGKGSPCQGGEELGTRLLLHTSTHRGTTHFEHLCVLS